MQSVSKVARIVLRTCVIAATVAGVVACDSGTEPPKAVAIVFMGDGNQSGTVGQAIVPGPQIQIRDSKGTPLSGVPFTVTVSGGGSLDGAPAKTTSASTALGTWTLGQTAGTQTLTVQSSGLPSLTIAAVATAGPASVASSAGMPTSSAGSVGGTAAPQPQIKLLDAFGNVIPGVTITVQITGGGSVQNPNPVTNSLGIASVGVWTLGTVAGTQRVTLIAGGLVTPIVYTATVEAGPATGAAAVGATNSTGTFSALAPISPSLKVVDAFGNGVAGVPVTVVVGAQSGTVTNASPVTDGSGVASVGLWTLGTASSQTITLSALGFPPVVFTVTATANLFNIEVRFVGGIPTAAAQAAFISAAARIQQVIVGDIPDFFANNINAQVCFSGNGLPAPSIPPVTETIDDLLIFAQVGPLDGVNNILGIGGPCYLRGGSALPFIGMMYFDQADVGNSLFPGVVLHEMLHVVGIGTLWQPSAIPSLAQGLGGSNPIFLGAQARTQFVAAGGTTPVGVPIENIGVINGGTRDGHWRQQNIFGNELMTGTIFPGFRPFSSISMASLADFGYSVSLATADPFTVLSGAGLRAGEAPTGFVIRERVVPPIFSVDSQGHLIPLPGARRVPPQR
jgi:hypothetical protein